jgi:hypothetical protein
MGQTTMERLIAVWCPALLQSGERGDEARAFVRVMEVAQTFCPWVDAVRLGLCALPSRGPSRFFGGEHVVVEKLTAAVEEVGGGGKGIACGPGAPHVGAADGLFAAMLAAQSRSIVPPGGSQSFLAGWPIDVLGRDELTVTLQRLGVRTLGQFAALPTRHVLARFGRDAETCHRVARGVEGELHGIRDPGIDHRLKVARGDVDDAALPRQPGFFGGTSEADLRAAGAFARLQDRLGVEAVLVGCVRGGRSPAERAGLVPWGAKGGGQSGRERFDTHPRVPADGGAPWPGRLPAPSPARVLEEPVTAEVVSDSGRPVGVTGRSLLTLEPSALSIAGEPWHEVAAWAGPWPAAERWWSTRRRRTRLQVVTVTGQAFLLVAERDQWRVEGIYE